MLDLSAVTQSDIDAAWAEKARADMRAYARRQWNLLESRPFVNNWHIDAICEHLTAVSRGEIKRLIINVPPRHMKSLNCNVFWPSWDWIDNPGRNFMFASYKSNLSRRDNLRGRRLVESDWHIQQFGDLRIQGTQVDFSNLYGGRRIVTSVGGGTTGEGADFIVIDDPISADDARSPTERDNVIFWFDETMKSRLNDFDTGAFIIIMQRLHEQDLTGHILASDTGYDHLCLPARYEPDHPTPIRSSIGFTDPRTRDGELLWQGRFTDKTYDDIAAPGTYVEAGQLQQRPAPRAGGMFQRKDFTILDTCPEIKRWVRGWDLAGSVDGDWTVGVAIGERADGAGYVVRSVVRLRSRPGGVEAKVHATTQTDNTITATRCVLPQDPGQAGVAQKQHYAKLLAGYPIRFERPSGDKETRATGFAAQCEIGRVYLMRGAWNDAFINEFTTFPRGKHDDQVDATATAFNDLANTANHDFR